MIKVTLNKITVYRSYNAQQAFKVAKALHLWKNKTTSHLHVKSGTWTGL